MGEFVQQNLNPIRLITDTLSNNKGTAETIGGIVEKATPAVLGYMVGGPVGAGIASGLHDWARTGDLMSGLKSGAISGATSYLGGKAFDALGGVASSGAANVGPATDLGSSSMAISPFEVDPSLSLANKPFGTSYLDSLHAGPLPGAEYVPPSMSIPNETVKWGTVGNDFTSPLGTPEARPWWGNLVEGGGMSGGDQGEYLYSLGGGEVSTAAPVEPTVEVASSVVEAPTPEISTTGGDEMVNPLLARFPSSWGTIPDNMANINSGVLPSYWDNILSTGSDAIGWMKDNPKTSLFATGILSNLLSSGMKKGREDEYRKALLDQMMGYQNDFRANQELGQWTGDMNSGSRGAFMKGESGRVADWIRGMGERAASNYAALGRGGGSVGKEQERIRREANNKLAQAFAQTYVPKASLTPDVSSYKSIAEAMTPSAGALESTVSGIAGTTGSILPYMYMLELLGRK